MWKESLETLRREEMWFKAAMSGTEDDIKRMGELICEDPNRFYCDWDHRKLLNCGKDSVGIIHNFDDCNNDCVFDVIAIVLREMILK